MLVKNSFLSLSIILAFMVMVSTGQLSSGGIVWADELPIPKDHPKDDLFGNPRCTACHDGDRDTVTRKPIQSFNHHRGWYEVHKFSGSHAGKLCRSCHKVSFCADCHASQDKLIPSLKHAGKPRRQLPHRGNYLFRHRIDGKIDPVRCYRCHDRRNNKQCKECHKNGQ